MNKKIILSAIIPLFLSLYSFVSAHVIVKPAQAGIGAYQTFTVNVPVEKNIPTTGLKLIIPEGLSYVTPNVKSGWKITTKKVGTGEDAEVTEIAWTNGVIPAGMRDEFSFSAKTPTTPTTLIWKAYQTYQDGTVVAWDVDQSHDDMNVESKDTGTYSTTKVIDDLASSQTNESSTSIPFWISIVTVILSGFALYRSKK